MNTPTQIHTKPKTERQTYNIQVVRHNQVCLKLGISSAKLFDMVARGQFPKPFPLIPGGRAVGWVEADVDAYILARKASVSQEVEA